MKTYPVISWTEEEGGGMKVWIKTGEKVAMQVVFHTITVEEDTLSGDFENPRRGQSSFTLKISPDKRSGEITFTGEISPADLICGNILPSGMEEE